MDTAKVLSADGILLIRFRCTVFFEIPIDGLIPRMVLNTLQKAGVKKRSIFSGFRMVGGHLQLSLDWLYRQFRPLPNEVSKFIICYET